MLLETTILDIVIYVVIVFQVLVCILLALMIMMQRPKQEGLGAAFGGDTMDSLTGAHATDFLQKGTAVLGTALFILTFSLSMLITAGASRENKSSTNGSVPPPAIDVPKGSSGEIFLADDPDADDTELEETETPTGSSTPEPTTPTEEKSEANQ